MLTENDILDSHLCTGWVSTEVEEEADLLHIDTIHSVHNVNIVLISCYDMLVCEVECIVITCLGELDGHSRKIVVRLNHAVEVILLACL